MAAPRISNSFSEGEVHVLDFILGTLLRGGNPAMAVRHKDFPGLYRKVVSMRRRLEEQRKRREASSVGTVRAPERVAVKTAS